MNTISLIFDSYWFKLIYEIVKTTTSLQLNQSLCHGHCDKLLPSKIDLKLMHTWWHHAETFSALLALFVGNSPAIGEFHLQRPVTRSFDMFFDLRLNNGWVNTREAGDWRRHRAHCDVTVMNTLNPSDDIRRKKYLGRHWFRYWLLVGSYLVHPISNQSPPASYFQQFIGSCYCLWITSNSLWHWD